jgi:hypothetical protein
MSYIAKVLIDAGVHSKHGKVIRRDFNRDRSRDLLIFRNCETFKRRDHNFIINIISTLIIP